MSQTEAESATRHTWGWRQDATTRVAVALIAIYVLLACVDQWAWPTLDNALRYQRSGVLEGELWRLLSGHFVHADLEHLALNVAGTVLIAALFPSTYTVSQWVWVIALSALAIDVGFLMLRPSLEWYVGASGILHGLLAAGAVAWWRSDRVPGAAMLAAILVVKLGWEQWRGALPLYSGLPVVVDAHAYGALGGLLSGLLFAARSRWSGQAQRASL